MVTVVIQYKNNPHNLAVLLTQLQPQLHPDDDIYILDESVDKMGLKIAVAYGATRCYIYVETSPHANFLESGIRSMVQNNQHALIYLSENCFISSTFISNMKKVMDSQYEIISPVVNINHYHKMDPNFKFFNPAEFILESADDFSRDCFMLMRQSKKSYGLLRTEQVSVLLPPTFLESTTRS